VKHCQDRWSLFLYENLFLLFQPFNLVEWKKRPSLRLARVFSIFPFFFRWDFSSLPLCWLKTGDVFPPEKRRGVLPFSRRFEDVD